MQGASLRHVVATQTGRETRFRVGVGAAPLGALSGPLVPPPAGISMAKCSFCGWQHGDPEREARGALSPYGQERYQALSPRELHPVCLLSLWSGAGH